MLTYKQKRSRKARQGITAMLLIALLLITGTFAWVSGTQRAFNPRWDLEGNHGGRIHDRFEIGEGAGAFDLNVFAENFGEAELFVRVQLHEFLAINGEPTGFGGAERDNPMGWPTYVSSNTNVNVRRYGTVAHEIGQEGIAWTLGQVGENVYMPTFNRAIHTATGVSVIDPSVPELWSHVNAHRMTEATGDAVDWFSYESGGRELPSEVGTHVSDYAEIGTQTGPGLDASAHRTLDDGTAGNWTVGDSVESPRLITHIVDPTDSSSDVELRLEDGGAEFTHYAMNSLTPALLDRATGDPITAPAGFNGVMTFHQWNELGRPAGNFWIHDSEGAGYFYWSSLLESGENPEEGITNATSLLLSSVEIENRVAGWEYVVHVDGMFFTETSIDSGAVELSTPAVALINEILKQPDSAIGGDLSIAADGTVTTNIPGAVVNPRTIDETIVVELPVGVDRDLVNIRTAGGWRSNVVVNADESITVTFISPLNLPAAAVGCNASGPDANIWEDSTGVEWCVVATEGDYSMLIARHAHSLDGIGGISGNRNHNTNEFVAWGGIAGDTAERTTANAAGPEIRGRLNTWFNTNANISPHLRRHAVHATLPTLNDIADTASSNERRLDTTAVSRPVAGSENGLPFFLSEADLNVRLGNSDAARQATFVDGNGVWYWLRSATVNSTSVSMVGANGAWASASASNIAGGVRPALWVLR